MEKHELQKKLDIEKWLLSENKGVDLCGSFDYCKLCDKTEQNPCASAIQRKTIATKPKTEINEKGYPVNVNVRSFSEKLSDADNTVKERYGVIQNLLLSFAKVTHRVSDKCDNYRIGKGNLVAKITIVGKTMRINLPLDPNDERYAGRKMPHRDLSGIKTYDGVPFQFIVTSPLALRRCFTLIEEVAKIKGLVKKVVTRL